MTDQLREGATIAVVGVAVVMTALTILMLAIMVLTRLARGNKEESRVMGIVKASEEEEASKESVAAIALAVALAMEEEKAGSIHAHGKSPVSGPTSNRWSAAGRERLTGSRGRAGHKWGRPAR